MTAPEPSHPLVGRQRWLVAVLRVALVIGTALAVGAMAVPGAAGARLAEGFIVLLVAVPTVRVAWLAVRWLRRGDLRFALVALGVLGILAAALLRAW